MKVLIAGCGWLGRALGRSLLSDGHEVIGIRRDPGACRALDAEGIESLCSDLCAPEARDNLAELPDDVDAVVACQSAGGRDAEAYRRAYIEATAPLLQFARRGAVRRLVFVGSTGVFGQDDGSEVDEATTPLPTRPTAQVLVEAERRVLIVANSGVPACVLRLSGLYGPGRYGVIRRVEDGRLALGPGDAAFMNWCHREDAVRAVRASIDRGQPGRVYHASDAEPTRRADVVRWISGRLGVEPSRTFSAPGRSANRRVSARATRRELGLSLAYPSFRDGLAPALSETAG